MKHNLFLIVSMIFIVTGLSLSMHFLNNTDSVKINRNVTSSAHILKPTVSKSEYFSKLHNLKTFDINTIQALKKSNNKTLINYYKCHINIVNFYLRKHSNFSTNALAFNQDVTRFIKNSGHNYTVKSLSSKSTHMKKSITISNYMFKSLMFI